MNRTRNSIALAGLIVASLSWAAPAVAQEAPAGVLTRDELRDLVEDRAAEDAEQRSALDSFLQRSEVRKAARKAGIDIRRVRSAARTLSDDEVQSLAPRLREAEAALVGGDAIVISSTALIIALLVLIIILVA